METGFEVKNNYQAFPSCVSISLLPNGEIHFLFKLLQLWENYKDKKLEREGRESKEIKGLEDEA